MINEAILCLAIASFKEARSEPIKAQYAVMEVIHNRSEHPDYPNSYCGVVKQQGQFSWFKNHGSLKPPKYELDAWKKSLEIAKMFKTKKTNYTKGAKYFNTVSLGVRYKTDVSPKRIGKQVFY